MGSSSCFPGEINTCCDPPAASAPSPECPRTWEITQQLHLFGALLAKLVSQNHTVLIQPKLHKVKRNFSSWLSECRHCPSSVHGAVCQDGISSEAMGRSHMGQSRHRAVFAWISAEEISAADLPQRTDGVLVRESQLEKTLSNCHWEHAAECEQTVQIVHTVLAWCLKKKKKS